MNKSLFKFLFLTCAFFPFYAFAQPSNDLCTSATSLTLGDPCVSGTTVGAADNITGVVGCQAGGANTGHNDVWYSFTASGSVFTASITTSAPFAGNVEVTLVAGSCASGTVINSNCAASPANVSFNGLTVGTSYFLVISNRGNGTPGPFTICNYTTTSSSCTANDDCSTAQTMTLNAVGSSSACITGCNTGASAGLDFVGNGCEDMLNPTVWYTFTTGATAAQINVSLTSAAMSDPEFVIFSNTTSCLGPYSILNCTEGTGGSAVSNSITVAANTTYYIAVSDVTGDQGNFNLCITQNPDNSACNTADNLTVTATSMGSPLAGPYQPGEQVTFQYTLTNWVQMSCNYIGAFVPTFGDCWAASSFTTNGMPAIINTPLNVNGVIQTSPLGPQNPCAGTPAGSWNWFPAGAATYNVAGGSLPAGAPMGAGWYFLSSYNPATGSCNGDPTDPDNTYGDGNYPDCGDNTFDYTLRFTLTAGPVGSCGLGQTDCGVSIKTYADGEFGAWTSIGCTVDLPVTMSPTLACCVQPVMTSTNTAVICSGDVVSISLTSDIGTSFTWLAAANASVTGESTTTQTTSVLSNTLTNTSGVIQNVIYTVTPTGTCTGIPQTITVTVNPTPTITVNSPTICSGTSTVLTASGGTTYSWTPGTSLSATTGATVTANPTTSIVYTITGTTNGCSATRTSTVTVNTTPTISVNSATMCSGSSTVLTASGGTTYSWTPGTSLNATTGATVSANPTTTIVYTVTGTTAGCSSANTSTVTVNAIPTTTASTTGTITCSTPSVVLNSTLAGINYTWTAPAGGLLGSVNSQSTTVSGASGIYTLNVQNAAGCNYSTTTSVTQNTTIPTTTASTTGTLTCTASTVALNSTLSGMNYTWTAPAGGSLGSANSQSTTASGAAGIYSLTVVNSTNGCVFTTTTAVTQNTTAPTGVSAGSNQTLTCASPSVTLTGSVATPTNATVNWVGANVCGTATSVVTSVCGAGVYTLTATNPSNGCTATSTVQVSPSAGAPTLTLNPITNTITCTNTSVTISISTTVSPVSYNWSGTGIVSGNGTGTITVNQGGSYNYTLTNTTNSCTTASNTVVIQNTTVPTTTASTTGTLTCSTTTVALNSTLSNMNYTWTAPAGGSVGSANTQSTSASGAAGTYTINVVNPANGCSYTTTTAVTQNTVVPTTTANVTGFITCTTTTATLNASLAGMNYTWTAPASGSIGSANSQSTSVTGAGTYSLSVLNPSNGCTFTTTATVTENTVAPTGVSAGSNQTLTCSSTSITLTGSVATPSNATLDWGTSVCGTQTTAVTSACAAGVYTLTATNPSNGCIASSTVEVFANAGAPTPSITSTALTIDCNNSTQSVTVTSTPSANVVYNWNNTPFSASSDSSIATFNNAGTYICTVTNTISNCSTPIQVVVSSNTTVPTISITATQTLTCASPTGVISTTVNPTSGITYTWTGTGVTGQSSTSVTINQAGDYTVAITNSANGCTNTASSHVDADANVPVASITATSSNTMITCLVPSVTLSVSATPAGTYSYTWSGGSNTSVQNATVTGIYTATVLNTVSGCTTTAQYTVTDNVVPPSVSVTNYTIPCGVPSATIGATASNVSYTWTTSGTGSILSGSNTATPSIGSAGQYIVTVVDNTTGCTNTETVNVTQNTIAATISANPISGTAPLSVDFSNTNVGGTNYSWNFGDIINNTSTSSAPSHTYNTVGTYIVTFTVTDASGLCSATSTLSIEVFENSVLIIPNVFTPNGDNSNDFFKIQSNGISTLNCEIINRWGQKMYTITSPSESWDGNANGAGPAPDGTYFFILKATGFDGKEYEEKGFINLFR